MTATASTLRKSAGGGRGSHGRVQRKAWGVTTSDNACQERQAEQRGARFGRGGRDLSRGLTPAPVAGFTLPTSVGEALPPTLQASLELAFNASFGVVRIHRDVHAQAATRAYGAQAFTSGADVFFAARAYDPWSPGGRSLIAHELTHVLQQTGRVGSGDRLEARMLQGSGGAVQCAPATPVSKSTIDEQNARFDSLVTFHRGGTAPTGDVPLETAITRAALLLDARLVTDGSKPAFSRAFNAAAETGEFQRLKSARGRSFAFDCLKLLGYFAAAGALLTDDNGFKLRTVAMIQPFALFLRQDEGFGRTWLADLLSQDAFKTLWPSAVLRGWRGFYLRPRFIPGPDPLLTRKIDANLAQRNTELNSSPPAMKAEHYWLVWHLIAELDADRIQEQFALRKGLLATSGSRSIFETLNDELPHWRADAAKRADDSTLPAYERTLSSAKIAFIDEAIVYWKKTFSDFAQWTAKLDTLSDQALLGTAALDLPDGSLVGAQASGLRATYLTAVTALFKLRTGPDDTPVYPAPDEYQQGLTALFKALTEASFALTKKGEASSWMGHAEAMSYAEATADKPNPSRQAQFAIFPLIVNKVLAQVTHYNVVADQAAPHFDDIRRAHRVRLARLLVALGRWLGWNEVVDAVTDVLSDVEIDYTGEPRLMLEDDWQIDDRARISQMAVDFPEGRDTPVLPDMPFTIDHLVEWFRYDYHHRMRETLETLLRAEPILNKETQLDFEPLDHLRQTRKELKASMAASAEAEYAIADPGALAIKVPQRFLVPHFEVLVPPGTQVRWGELIAMHPKTQMQLIRRAAWTIVPQERWQGVFAWALPSLAGLVATMNAIPTIVKLAARQTGEKNAALLSRLSPAKTEADGSVSDAEKAKVRLSDADWKLLNQALLRWLQTLGEHEEKQLPGLARRVIILRRRLLALKLNPRIEHFAKYPYVSHGPWGETNHAMADRLNTPDDVIAQMRNFESSARPMREPAHATPSATQAGVAEPDEREVMQHAVDVQLVLLTLSLADALLKLDLSTIDGGLKTHLYEYFQLSIDHVEDEQKLKALKAGTGVNDEAVAVVYSSSHLAGIVQRMKKFMTAVEVELQESQSRRGFGSEDGVSIRPNAERISHAIKPYNPSSGDIGAQEWRLHMALGDDGQFDETTGVSYRLVKVYCKFEFHPQAGSQPLKSLRKGAGGPFSPARIVIEQAGQRTEYTAPNFPDIDLFKLRQNDREFIVRASDIAELNELDDVFLWRSFSIGLKELSAGIETFVDWMRTVGSILFPEVAIAEFVVGIAQMLANHEFDDLIKQLKDDPIAFVEHALGQLRDKLFNPDRIWEYLLIDGGQHSPFAALQSFLPKRKPKINPGPSSKLGRVVGALRTLGGRFVHGLERVHQYTQPPLRRAQGQIAMHPTLVWVLHRAAHIAQATFDLIPQDKLDAARKGDGPSELVDFVQALLGDRDQIDKELRERVIELFEGIQRFELPGQLVDLAPAMEMIIGFILDRFGKRGKMMRMLLSVMPVPESWAGEGERKGFTNALHFLASLITKTWVAGSALDPNVYWQRDIMPLIGDKFTEVRDDLVAGLYASADGAMKTLGMGPLARPDKSALPKTEVAPEPLIAESEGSAASGAAGGSQPSLPAGGGTRLGAAARGGYERQLGADLSHVRVHANAASATQPVGADALTSGSHVYLRPGVAPASPQGHRLMAHELTHVVQQTGPQGLGTPGSRTPALGRAGVGLRIDHGRESAADQVAAGISGGTGVSASLRTRIGSAEGVQPLLSADMAIRVVATLSTANETADFTKHLDGGRDPEGMSDAKALANQVFAMLRSEAGMEYAGFIKDSSSGKDVRKLVREYLQELTNKFPDLELKRIAALAQTPRKKTAESDPDTQLSPKSFVQLLANYLFAARHVALKIETDKAIKKVQKIEIFNLNMGKIGGNSQLWDLAMANSFGSNTAVTEKARAQREMRERLNSIGPLPKVWDSTKFRFSQWLINDYVEMLKARALGKVEDVPAAKIYVNTDDSSARGLAVSTHTNLTGRGIGPYERESHHTSQYLLVEFFGNLTEATQKAFPAPVSDFAGAGINFRSSGSNEVDSIDGASGSPLKVSPLNPNSERGGKMPAILLAARTHQRGELHVLRESRWEDKSGDKERRGTATQGLAIENIFNQAVEPAELRPRDNGSAHRVRLREAIKANPTAAKTAYYKAALTTYQWMNTRMIGALKDGLLREEYAYYRGIAARNHTLADGTTLDREFDLKPEQLNAVHDKADKNNTRLMGEHNWKA